MKKDELDYLLKAHKIYREGLTAEDAALSSRSNNLLAFNSLLALAFVVMLSKEFNKEWYLLIYIIPMFAIILNILWIYLGSRTFLSFMFFYKQCKKIEKDFENNVVFKTKTHLKYFQYVTSRSKYFDCERKGLLRLISHRGGANKIFCFILPNLSYIFWVALLIIALLIKKRCTIQCIVPIMVGFFGALILGISISIMITLNSKMKNKKRNQKNEKNV